MTYRKTLPATVLALAMCSTSSRINAAVWSAGHGDLGIAYEGGELEPHWHIGEDNETVVIDGVSQSFGPEGTEFEADELTAQTDLTDTREAGVAWDFIGVASGASFYLFPEASNPTVPFIGIGTEELNPADWTGDLTLTLTGMTGPGQFSLYTTDSFDNPTALMSTNDAISGADAISLAPDDHAHYNWAFSREGSYDLTFEVEGMHAFDGLKTASATFTFSAVPEPSHAGLLMALAGLGYVVTRRKKVLS